MDNEYRPFCSEKCRLLDLGSWLTEEYGIADQNTDFTEYPVDDTGYREH